MTTMRFGFFGITVFPSLWVTVIVSPSTVMVLSTAFFVAANRFLNSLSISLGSLDRSKAAFTLSSNSA